MATQEDYSSILIPTNPFKQLKIAEYISHGKKKKLFKGECIRTSAMSYDDPYYYYVEEGQIVAMFEKESGGHTPLFWRNAGNAFPAECSDFASIGRYKARFEATQNSVVFAFSQNQLYKLMQDDPEIFYEYVYVCHMSFAQMGHRISNTGHQSSTKRMTMWLQKLCATHEPEADGSYRIPCTMTLQQLSDLLLIHITTCTKLVAALEAEHVIKRTKTHLYVYDIGKLELYGLEENSIVY